LIERKQVDGGYPCGGSMRRLPVPTPVLHILLSNLVGNAFAHSEAGEVRIDVEGGRLRIANSGGGIDPALRGQLQQPFVKREGSAGSVSASPSSGACAIAMPSTCASRAVTTRPSRAFQLIHRPWHDLVNPPQPRDQARSGGASGSLNRIHQLRPSRVP
jgi:hypothetical protein